MNMHGKGMLLGLTISALTMIAPISSVAAPASLAVAKKSSKARIKTCDDYPRDVLLNKAEKYNDTIYSAARKYHVSPKLIIAVIAVESCFRPKARSHAGAAGLMQLMPATARRFGVTDRYDHEHNIMAGTRYLKFLMKRFDGNIVLTSAAYNAGEGAVDRHDGVPPYRETQAYVKKVLAVYKKLGARTAQQRPSNPAQAAHMKRRQQQLQAQQRHRQRLLEQRRRQQLRQQAILRARHQRRPLSLSLPELDHAYKLIADDKKYEPVLNLKQFL